jgi:hypothetical protein
VPQAADSAIAANRSSKPVWQNDQDLVEAATDDDAGADVDADTGPNADTDIEELGTS